MKNYLALNLKKNESLLLTDAVKIEFPEPKPIQKSMLSQFKAFIPMLNQEKLPPVKKIIPIPEQLVVLLHGNALRLYQYRFNSESKLECSIHSELYLNFNVRKLKVFQTGKTLNGRNFYIIAEDETRSFFELIEFRTDQNCPVAIKMFKVPSKIYTWGFVAENEIFVWMENMNLYHYRIHNQGFHLLQIVKTKIDIKSMRVKYSQILGFRDFEQEKIINIFYILYDDSQKKIRVNCRELIYPMEGKLIMKEESHEIISIPVAEEILTNIKCFQRENSILLRFDSEVIIIQKKFSHYYATDNLYKKDKTCTIRVAERGVLVCCYVEGILEINEIQLTETKIRAPMIDFLDFKKIPNEYMSDIWLIQNGYKAYPLLALKDNEDNYVLRLANRVLKIQKLTKLANENPIEELDDFRKLGEVLGVNETEFYYNMWLSSPQTLADLQHYLMNCNDYQKIKYEIHNYLRRRQMPVGKLSHFMKKLSKITLNKLKYELSEKSLLQFFESSFIERKFDIYSSEYLIDNIEFKETLEISLYDMVINIINNKLFPKKIVYSPWDRVKKDPPKINILQILNAFKLSLLEDYEEFLFNILSHYESKVPEIIQNFSELLPEHPFNSQVENALLSDSMINEVKLTKQSQFFSEIYLTEIKRQPAFIDNVFEELYPHYQTSYINKKLELIQHHSDVKKKKYISHIIIKTPLEQYVENVKCLSGLKIFIYICQFVAQTSFKKNIPNRLEELLIIFQDEYKVDSDSIFKLRINTLFYELMLKQAIIEPEVRLEDVIKNPVEKYIGLFFLGNKQKKSLIFNEYMKIFESKYDFAERLKAYVHSEHCSKIELTMLIDLIAQEKRDFQIENQHIIDVIIDGFCARIQLRDIDDANHFRDRIKSIQLESQLLIKVDKIDKIKVCLRIFDAFYMDNLTFQVLLSQTIHIIDMMMEKFFNAELRNTHVTIDKKKKPKVNHVFEDLKGMFELLNYLRENIFFNLPAEELVLTYCKKLIQWQQFEQLEEYLYESEWIRDYGLKRQGVIYNLMKVVLKDLYEDQSLLFDEETKNYIKKIISIDHHPETNDIVIREEAKLKLVELFSQWGFTIRLNNLEIMVNQWHQCLEEAERQEKLGGLYSRVIMSEIIEEYWQYLDLQSLEEIYQCFMITSTFKKDIETKTDEFYNYCSKLAQVLLNNGRYRETSEIIRIVNEKFQPNYQLMSQCLLKSMEELYLQDEKIVKRYIDYFIINWQINQQLLDMKFENYFEDDLENYEEENFYVSTDLCFKNHRHKIPTDFLWDIVFQAQKKLPSFHKMEEKIQRPKNIHNIYFNYFFLSMGLVHPNLGFSVIEFIDYDHNSLYNLFRYLEEEFTLQEKRHENKFLPVDFSIIFKTYLNALTKLIVCRNENIKLNDENSLAAMAETLENVRDEIKKGRYKNDQLAVCITKMVALCNDANRKKGIRFNQYNFQIRNKIDLFSQIRKIGRHNVTMEEGSPKKKRQAPSEIHNVTISFDDFKKMKRKLREDKDLSISMGMENNTERMIVSQILNNIGTIKQDMTMINMPVLPSLIMETFQETQKKSFDQPFLEEQKPIKTKQQFIQLINSQNYTGVDYWSSGAVYAETLNVYHEEDVLFWKIVSMFFNLCVGSNNKVQVLQIAGPENISVSNQILKNIFTLEYLNSEFAPSWEEEEVQLFIRIKEYANEFSEEDIITLSNYLDQISKIEFKKKSKTDWQNNLVRLVIDTLSEKEEFQPDEICKVYELVPLFSKNYLKEHQQEILESMKIESLKEAFVGSLDLAKKQKKLQ